MGNKISIRNLVFYLLFVSAGCLAAPNTFVYPISLHYFKGTYYIGDRGREAILSYKSSKPTTLYQTQDNTKLDLPLGLSDDGNHSIIVSDPGVCALSKIDVRTGTLSRFSPPSASTPSLCPRFVTKYAKGLYAFTNFDKQSIVKVNAVGKQTQIAAGKYVSSYGIAAISAADKTPSFAVADAAKHSISLINQNGTKFTVLKCHGQDLKFPFSMVSLGNKIYFDDVVLNALFSYDIKTRECEKLSSQFIKPMGMAVSGSNIGIIDAGKRALMEYDPSTRTLKTLYQDRSPITTLKQPWDIYVTPTNVYVTDYKRGAILKISKSLPHTLTVVSSAARGTGAAFLTAYALAGSATDPNIIYVSDASHDLIFSVNLKNGDRTIFSGNAQQGSKHLNDPTTMTEHNSDLYIADWSNSAVIKINSKGAQSEIVRLKSPPLAISSVVNNNVYVTQPETGSISKINIVTAKVQRLIFNCPTLKVPLGIVAMSKNTLLVSDAKLHLINNINLKSKTCKKIASIPTTTREKAWLMKKYDADHLIIDVFNSNKLYLANIKTGKVTAFL